MLVAERDRQVQPADPARGDGSVAVETTLSSRSYLDKLRGWIDMGYRTSLHFIELPSADFAVQRVAARVAAGGHAVPEADVRRRFERGVRLFAIAYKPLVDRWYHWVSDDRGLRLGDYHQK